MLYRSMLISSPTSISKPMEMLSPVISTQLMIPILELSILRILPSELLMDVLSLLPVRDLVRCMLVSRAFLELVSTVIRCRTGRMMRLYGNGEEESEGLGVTVCLNLIISERRRKLELSDPPNSTPCFLCSLLHSLRSVCRRTESTNANTPYPTLTSPPPHLCTLHSAVLQPPPQANQRLR